MEPNYTTYRRSPWWAILLLTGLFAAGLGYRWYGSIWEGENAWVHPDENRMAIACGDIQFLRYQGDWKNFLKSREFEALNPNFFAYGHFPIYLYKVAQEGVRRLQATGHPYARLIPYAATGIYGIGRGLTGFAGAWTILLIFLIGKRAYGPGTGLLGAAFLTFTVLHVQLSHYMTVDTILTWELTFIVLGFMKILDWGRLRDYIVVGILWGVAFATKLNAAFLLPVFALAHSGYLVRTGKWRRLSSFKQWFGVLLMGLFMGVSFFLSEPFAWFDQRQFLFELKEESAKVQGESIPVFMIQYIGTPRYWYQLSQMVTWSYGPVLGLLVCAGCVYGLYDLLLRFRYRKMIPWVWAAIYFVLVANLQVKWLRHMLPFLPFGCLYAAVAVTGIASSTRRKTLKVAMGLLALVVLAFSVAYTESYRSIYTRDNPRTKASYWIYENVLKGTNILIEHWDESLPISIPGRRIEDYPRQTMGPYNGASPSKVQLFAQQLHWGGYLFLNSRRLYGATMRVPDRYPYMNRYYRLLFEGKLGYTLEKVITTYPRLGPFEIVDDLADESFSVYDHPKVMIFKNIGQLSEEELINLIMDENVSIEKPTYDEMLLWYGPGAPPPNGNFLGFRVRFSGPEENFRPQEKPKREVVPPPEKKLSFSDFLKGAKPTLWEGGRGTGNGQFSEPRDIAIDRHGLLYVADFRNYRVQKFGSDGAFLKAWGQQGSGNGEFRDPSGIAISPSGEVWVVDTWNQRLQAFDQEGTFLKALAPVGNDSLFAPTDVAFDSSGRAYVTDTGHKRVLVLSKEGKPEESWSKVPGDTGLLGQPSGVAVNSKDEIFVADTDRRKIWVFGTDGVVKRSWPLPEKGSDRPQLYLALLDNDRIAVSDTSREEIRIYSSEGPLLSRLEGAGDFESQMGLTPTKDGALAVVDTWNHRVAKVPLKQFTPVTPQ